MRESDKTKKSLIGGAKASRHYDRFLNSVRTDKTGDEEGERQTIGLVDSVDPEYNRVIFRSLEAGDGVEFELIDADENVNNYKSDFKKIRINVPAIDGGGITNIDLKVHDAEVETYGQIVFDLPSDAISINTVTLNGLETTNWLFTLGPPRVSIDMATEGYDLEPGDEVLVFYHI